MLKKWNCNCKFSAYNINEIKSLSIRASYQGKMNYISTESFTDEDILECLKTLKDGAPYLSSENPESIYDGSGEYKEVHNEESDFDQIPLNEKINLLKDVEGVEAIFLSNLLRNNFDFSDTVAIVNELKSCFYTAKEKNNSANVKIIIFPYAFI